MVSLTAGCETIGFFKYYFRKRKKHKGLNNFVNTNLMKPSVFSHSISETLKTQWFHQVYKVH